MAVRNPAQRIKGQEVSILVTLDSVLQDTIVDIQSFKSIYLGLTHSEHRELEGNTALSL